MRTTKTTPATHPAIQRNTGPLSISSNALRIYKSFEKREKEIIVLNLLKAEIERNLKAKVILHSYYDHHTLFIVSQYEYTILHFTLSHKEYYVPVSELKRFLEVAKKNVNRVTKKYTNTLANKKCSGIFYIIVGNFAEKYCGSLRIQKTGTYCTGTLILKRQDPSDISWFTTAINAIANWVNGRIQGIIKHCDQKNRDYKDDPLYKYLSEFKRTLVTAKVQIIEIDKDLFTPEEKALLLLSAGLLRSLGIPSTAWNTTLIYNSLLLTYRIKAERLDPSKDLKATEAFLHRVCLTKRYNDTIEFKPPRCIVTASAQMISAIQHTENEYTRKIRIFRDDMFKKRFEHCLLLYTAHWFTKRKIAPNWDFFGAVISTLTDLLTKLNVHIDHEVLWNSFDELQKINPDKPAFPLTDQAVKTAWKTVYFKIYSKRR